MKTGQTIKATGYGLGTIESVNGNHIAVKFQGYGLRYFSVNDTGVTMLLTEETPAQILEDVCQKTAQSKS